MNHISSESSSVDPLSDPIVPDISNFEKGEAQVENPKENIIYKDLQSPENQSVRKKMVKEHFRYASYLYMGVNKGSRHSGDEHGILLSTSNKISKLNGVMSLNRQKKEEISKRLPVLQAIEDRLKSEFDFKVDNKGNFYNLETGTVFNLVYDHEREEIIVCFVGLNYQDNLQTDPGERERVKTASFMTALGDIIGTTVPEGVRQCIDIGKMIKEVTQGSGIQSVMVGHSHGGGLAQATAVANGLKGIIINSRSLGVQTKAFIGEGVIEENKKNITAFSVRGDWLTEAKKIGDLRPIFETMLKTHFFAALLFASIQNTPILPNIGEGYYLPLPAGATTEDAHRHFYRAFQILRKGLIQGI